jgi:hypothetical protein
LLIQLDIRELKTHKTADGEEIKLFTGAMTITDLNRFCAKK